MIPGQQENPHHKKEKPQILMMSSINHTDITIKTHKSMTSPKIIAHINGKISQIIENQTFQLYTRQLLISLTTTIFSLL